jgi:hypothetical protein
MDYYFLFITYISFSRTNKRGNTLWNKERLYYLVFGRANKVLLINKHLQLKNTSLTVHNQLKSNNTEWPINRVFNLCYISKYYKNKNE